MNHPFNNNLVLKESLYLVPYKLNRIPNLFHLIFITEIEFTNKNTNKLNEWRHKNVSLINREIA